VEPDDASGAAASHEDEALILGGMVAGEFADARYSEFGTRLSAFLMLPRSFWIFSCNNVMA
jgi:hypothetical protein